MATQRNISIFICFFFLCLEFLCMSIYVLVLVSDVGSILGIEPKNKMYKQ